MSVNKVFLLGNVVRDAEVKTMSNGNEVANFTLATNDSWKDKQTGEKKDKVEYHKIVVFSTGLVGIVKNYVKKGSKLYVEGSLQTRKWTDKDNNDKYVTEIVLQGYGCALQMLDGKSDGANNTDSTTNKTHSNEFVGEIEDDDIPF